MEKNITADIHGIKCDNPNCTFKDMSIPFSDYEKWVDKPCPECGENLLSKEDYEALLKLLAGIELINEMTEDQLKNLSIPENSETTIGEDIDLSKPVTIGVNIKGGKISFGNIKNLEDDKDLSNDC